MEGTRLCHRNLLPTTNPSLTCRFFSNSVIHHTSFHNYKTNFSKFLVSATMEASFKPEEARVPAALPLPTPPVTKATFSLFLLHFYIIDYNSYQVAKFGHFLLHFYVNIRICVELLYDVIIFFVHQFKIALCQLSVTTDKERNIAHVQQAIEDAADKGAQLILLPEIWNSPYSNDSFPVYAEDIDAGGDASPSTRMLSEVSRSRKITIIGGSIPERSGDKLYNSCCVFGTDGKLLAKHRKIHLFDIDIPGKMTFKESRTLTAGERPTIVDTEVGRIGIGICYDIRFQELAAIYAARGAHLLCYPGAFNMTTGPLHWELLQRARITSNIYVTCPAGLLIASALFGVKDYAVFSSVVGIYLSYPLCTYSWQLYVATCSPARDGGSSYVAWGHSTLVGPFGEVLVTTEHEETTLIAEIDYSVIEQRRTYLPFQKQRRGDLYQLVDVDRLNSTGTK
ncbi:hypothetical protein H5410_037243 [Solanum commersonii]|uniref:CN hydrolase domain-containing protein n=1 Tax=Solanum commersonii TaxID=4109 RepID=A0A9J5Y5Q5_SOLCO|nr:hypothetical protein H5410_037243 [Solanum commersonii]